MTRIVADWKPILSFPLSWAPNASPLLSMLPRRLVTSSSRARMTTTIQGTTPVIVVTFCGIPLGSFHGIGEIFSREEDEASQHQHLIDERIDHAAEGAFHFPSPGKVSIEEIGEQGDEINDQGDVEPEFIAMVVERALVLVIRQHGEEDARQHEPRRGQSIGHVPKHEAGIVAESSPVRIHQAIEAFHPSGK